jgi:transaldolase
MIITGMKLKFCSFSVTQCTVNCAKIGADVMTGPLGNLRLIETPLTIGLAQFVADFEKGNK